MDLYDGDEGDDSEGDDVPSDDDHAMEAKEARKIARRKD